MTNNINTDTKFLLDAQEIIDYIGTNPVLTEAEEIAIDEYMDECNRLESARIRRKQRLSDCGKWGYYFDPHTGKKSGYIVKCDLFRECPRCLEARAKQEYEWLKKASFGAKKNMLFAVVDDQAEGTKLLRGINKKQYVRYPQENGYEYIFLDGSLDVDVTDVVTPDLLRQLNWESVVKTPEGRNKSGTMHVPTSTASPEPFAIIEVNQFVPDAPPKEVDQAATQAIAQTLDADPKTPQEVREQINRRVAITVEILLAKGYKVRTYSKKIKVIKSKIKWAQFSRVNINLNTENPTYNSVNTC